MYLSTPFQSALLTEERSGHQNYRYVVARNEDINRYLQKKTAINHKWLHL